MRKLIETLREDRRESDCLLPSRPKQGGFVLVVAVIVMSVLLMVAVPSMSRLSGQFRTTQRFYKSLAAMNLAEAGAERAIWELNYSDISTWAGDANQRTLTISGVQASGGGVVGDIVITVTSPETNTPVVESTGKVVLSGNQVVEKKVRLELEKNPILFDFALFGHERVKFDDDLYTEGEVFVDSYDSRDGEYGADLGGGSFNLGSVGHVGTNTTRDDRIDLPDAGVIKGGVYTGLGSDPNNVIKEGSNVVITGGTHALTQAKDIPPVGHPEGLPYAGNYKTGQGTTITINQSTQYRDFEIEDNAVVTIIGDVELSVTHDFKLKSNARLEIADGASLKLYVGHKIEMNDSSQMNNVSKIPSNLILMGTADFHENIHVKLSTPFYGVIYVHGTDVYYETFSEFYGIILSKKVEVKKGAHFHYDAALENYSLTGERTPLFVVKTWREEL